MAEFWLMYLGPSFCIALSLVVFCRNPFVATTFPDFNRVKIYCVQLQS